MHVVVDVNEFNVMAFDQYLRELVLADDIPAVIERYRNDSDVLPFFRARLDRLVMSMLEVLS